ncbi:hypothetical protein J437_LFUL002111 [Ladona fulva]|uniref:Uncharacterized protein n=1 Tax=Ladona fulva TaxID=123851 RepID=A0A8K0JSY2_LADFU|nr:hypothetical protein J437_LFUL002111 [Ladona fulva]
MKVNLATQIFSRSMAAYVEEGTCSQWLPEGTFSTAWFLGFMDELFDSMNSDCKGAGYKPLKNVVSAGSPHFHFWERAAMLMKDLQIVKKRNVNSIAFCPMTPTQKDTKVNTRAFNQDPLENLFGCIRGNCGSNTHPTATQFIGSLKSSIISGLAFSASTGRRNCEEDDMALLDSLRSLIGTSGEVERVREEEIKAPFLGFLETDTSDRNAVETRGPCGAPYYEDDVHIDDGNDVIPVQQGVRAMLNEARVV